MSNPDTEQQEEATPQAAAGQYRYIGYYASEIIIGDKTVPVAPGDFVDLSEEDLGNIANNWMLSEGSLISTQPPSSLEAEEATPPEPPVEETPPDEGGA
jgi:hypothetical protein